MKLSARILILFITGFCLGPIGDYFHVQTETTGYPLDRYAYYFFGLPYWVPLIFGMAAVAVGLSHPWLDQILPGDPSRPGARNGSWALGGVLIFLALYVASGLLPGPAGSANDALMGMLALMVWAMLDRTWQGIFLGIVTALSGTLVEILMVQADLFFYHPGRDNLFGVPSWLPWLYFAASVTLGNFGRYLTLRRPAGAQE